MKKKIWIYLVTIAMAGILVGCGKEVSNDVITISDYKELAVEDKEDTESVWQALLDNCTVEQYPQEELEKRIEELKTQYGYIAGKTAEEVIQEIYGATPEELAQEQLKKEYAVALIAEKEGLTFDEKEYEEELQQRAEANGVSDIQEYESMYGEEELRARILEERVLQFLVDNLK